MCVHAKHVNGLSLQHMQLRRLLAYPYPRDVGSPKDADGNTGIVVFVDRLSKMAHLAAVPDTIDGVGTAKLFIDRVFRQHGLPLAIISDRERPSLHWKVLEVNLPGAWHDESLNADSIVGLEPRHPGLSPSDVCVVTREPLSDVGRNGDSLNANESIVGSETSKVEESINLGDTSIPSSSKNKVSVKRRQRRRKAAMKHKASAPSPCDNSETLYTLVNGLTGDVEGDINLGTVPSLNALLELDEMSVDEFGKLLKVGDFSELMVIRPDSELNSSSLMDESVLEDTKSALSARSGSSILKDPLDPYYPLVKEFQDVVCHEPPSVLPPDRGVRHEIDLIPGTKYCVTRQWPLPKEQCDVIDDFFRAKHAAGMVRESKSPHSTPTFCVRKSNGK